MNKYFIISDGIELDTYEEIDISLNYQIDDIMNIEKRKTNFSKTIKLPGTPKNNKFFKHIFEVNIDNINFNVNKSIKSTIRIGDNQIFSGFLQLMNFTIKNKEVIYECSISGDLKNILTNLSDYTLRDLDVSEYNHTRDRANIIDTWDYKIKSFSNLLDDLNKLDIVNIS